MTAIPATTATPVAASTVANDTAATLAAVVVLTHREAAMDTAIKAVNSAVSISCVSGVMTVPPT